MTTKHTPGPWRVDDEEIIADVPCGSHSTTHIVCFGHDYDDVGGICARVHETVEGNFDEAAYNAECEANARLIAAAPELLEALKWILDYTESDGYADAIYGERWVKTKQLLTRIDGETT
jgi:hypothetical protein